MARRGRPPIDQASRRAALLLAAARACNRDGLDAVRMEDIGNAAGLSKIPLYRQFENKDALIEAMLEDAYQRMAGAIEHGAKIRPCLSGVLAAAREAPELFQVLLRTSRDHPRFGAKHQATVQMIADAVLAPLIAGGGTDSAFSRRSAEALAAMLHTATMTHVLQAPPKEDEVFLDWADDLATAWTQATHRVQAKAQ